MNVKITNYYKNVTGLAELFGKNKRLRKLINLVIVAGFIDSAESQDREEIQEIQKMHSLIKKYNMNGDFRWIHAQTDRIRNGELYRYIADTKGAFIQPALYEAFGLTVIEAMTCGLPTFATSKGGPAEIIIEGVSGFHIDPLNGDESGQKIADFFEKCRSDPTYWTEISNGGLQRIFECYTWKIYAKKLVDLTATYGFWRSASSQQRNGRERYMEMFYNLKLRDFSIMINHPGDHRGPSKISLHVGSLLVMQGNVADIAKQSICSSPMKRITLTFVKVHPTKAAVPSTGMQNSLSSSNLQRTQVSAQQNISIPSSRDERTTRQPTTKHYVPASVSGVLPFLPVTPPPSQPLSAPAMPQLFPPSQGAGAAYSPVAVVPPAWPTAPRGASRVLSPGTGVFLPPGGSNRASHLASLSQQPSSDTSSTLSNGETTNATSTDASVTSCSMPSISNNESPSQVAIENSEKESEKADVVKSSQSESEKADDTFLSDFFS